MATGLRSVGTSMDYVVGIDIGHSTGDRATTGLVVLKRDTLDVLIAQPVVTNGVGQALSASLKDEGSIGVAVIDGPLAPPRVLRGQRLCEQLFSSGVFASSGNDCRRLRLQPAPTRDGCSFLVAASAVANTLMSLPFNIPQYHLELPIQPSVVEIFPTIFMAALLPPQCYNGSRSAHTDYLWTTLMTCNKGKPLTVLQPYAKLLEAVENQPNNKAKHEVRSAAMCAIAAHAIAEGVPFGFIGTEAEQGFLMPGTRDRKGWMDAEFRDLLAYAWERRPDKRCDFQWL